MNALGKYLLSGSLQAVGLVSLLTAISMLLPPFSYIISGAPVSLITLRKGPAYSIRIVIGSLLLVTLFGQLAGMGPAAGLVFALGVWSPVWLCSALLRTSESQGMVLYAAAGAGVALVLGTSLYSEQMTVVWQSWRDQFLAQQNLTATEMTQVQQVFDTVGPYLNGIVAGGMVISLIMTVLLARWWQSRLFNPGGFRTEFQKLLLPRWFAILLPGLLILGQLNPGDYGAQISNVLIVLVIVHVFQGLASVHRAVTLRKMSSNWLIAMYILLLFLPQMSLFVACIGALDIWVRNRKSAPDDNSQGMV